MDFERATGLAEIGGFRRRATICFQPRIAAACEAELRSADDWLAASAPSLTSSAPSQRPIGTMEFSDGSIVAKL
jgi:hypothetical protein